MITATPWFWELGTQPQYLNCLNKEKIGPVIILFSPQQGFVLMTYAWHVFSIRLAGPFTWVLMSLSQCLKLQFIRQL